LRNVYIGIELDIVTLVDMVSLGDEELFVCLDRPLTS
jgi:hypothetical protein